MKSRKGFLWSATVMVFFAYVAPDVKNAAAAEALQVHVAGLKANDLIPQRFAYNHAGCSGDNISPEISWAGVPASAKSLALVVWDQDAPVSGGRFPRVMFKTPSGTRSLAESARDSTSRECPPPPGHFLHHSGGPR